MHVFKEIAPIRAHLKTLRSTPNSVGFVPTMGALHQGHLSLIRASRQSTSITVCSIYVNPTQFGNAEDLEKYPRTLEQDLTWLEQEGCDIVFCPDNKEMYGDSKPIQISFPGLDNILEGAFRPGHFSGVAQVVAKLFNIIQPDRAFFGQKDFQQVMVVSQLVQALKLDVEIVSLPIIREADGLAMSSRNQRLSTDERNRATILYTSLVEAKDQLRAGLDFKKVEDQARLNCEKQGVVLEYLAIADRKAFTLLEHIKDPSHAVILIAAKVGSVRLIDNLLLQP